MMPRKGGVRNSTKVVVRRFAVIAVGIGFRHGVDVRHPTFTCIGYMSLKVDLRPYLRRQKRA